MAGRTKEGESDPFAPKAYHQVHQTGGVLSDRWLSRLMDSLSREAVLREGGHGDVFPLTQASCPGQDQLKKDCGERHPG